MAAGPVRIGTYPNQAKTQEYDSKQYRIYDVEGKSTTLCGQGGGMGAKTGLYAVPCLSDREIDREIDRDSIVPVYEVCDGIITIKNKQYPIKLRDGYYIIRKLTVDKCKRLQTVPEWYDFSVISNSQAYKCLGNGWTVEVVAWLVESCER